jgi:hypothetical protein
MTLLEMQQEANEDQAHSMDMLAEVFAALVVVALASLAVGLWWAL